ncbi:MAG: HIT domain-containing protein [Bauldia sp.]|nr:HIT domain-containing protein [Bauldia sp.]
MAYDDSNIFARILRGEIPSHKVFEDAETLAFMDVSPISKGHTLVVPKVRARNVLDAPPEALAAVAVTVGKVARAAKAAFEADGVAIMQFNEAPAGQSVFHLHFHVVPRWVGVALKPHGGPMEKPEVLKEHAERIRAALV